MAARPGGPPSPAPWASSWSPGLVVLLFVVYELFVTDLLNEGKQSDLSQQLHEQDEGTAASPTTPRADLTGGAFAVLYIPRLGSTTSAWSSTGPARGS